jgi:hypothetical protein
LNIIGDLLKRVPYEEVPRAKIRLPKRKVAENVPTKHKVDHVEEQLLIASP